MTKTGKNFYVVWVGRKTGLFDNRDECKEQIHQFPEAKYKGFKTRELAEEALISDSKNYIGKDIFESTLSKEQIKILGKPILESISVDGARNTSTGLIEYQGVDTKTKKLIFRQGPFQDGTNNIAEFLGLVHALAHCKKNKLSVPIYTDSRIAMSWVKHKEARTNQEKTEKNKGLFDMISRAEKWLKENEYKNKILKWETQAWGEVPADFGRK